MNEISNREESMETVLFKMPRNMRQIGQGDEKKRIYVEDYVMTYLKQLSVKQEPGKGYVVLLGHFVKMDQDRNVFINAAIEIKECANKEIIEFTNEIWTSIYEDVKEYFSDVEIVGWGILDGSLSSFPSETVKKLHNDNFSGPDKVLLCYESIEREETFFLYEEGRLKRQSGYYIYYEKNEEMQSYMLDQNDGTTRKESYDDRALKEIRKVIASKKIPNDEKSSMWLLYGAGTLVMVVLLVLGTGFLANNDRIRGMEETLNVISKNLEKEEELTTKVEKIGASPVPKTTIKEENIIGDEDNPTKQEEEVERKENDNKEQIENGQIEKDQREEDQIEENQVEEDEIEEDEREEDQIEEDQVEREAKSKQVGQAMNEDDTDSNQGNLSQEAVNSENYYIVKQGDSLASISMKHYNSLEKVAELQRINNIKDMNKILIGDKIILPE